MAERVDCPRHGCKGALQIKLFVEHWDPMSKGPKMCLMRLEDLPLPLQKAVVGLRLRHDGGQED